MVAQAVPAAVVSALYPVMEFRLGRSIHRDQPRGLE